MHRNDQRWTKSCSTAGPATTRINFRLFSTRLRFCRDERIALVTETIASCLVCAISAVSNFRALVTVIIPLCQRAYIKTGLGYVLCSCQATQIWQRRRMGRHQQGFVALSNLPTGGGYIPIAFCDSLSKYELNHQRLSTVVVTGNDVNILSSFDFAN